MKKILTTSSLMLAFISGNASSNEIKLVPISGNSSISYRHIVWSSAHYDKKEIPMFANEFDISTENTMLKFDPAEYNTNNTSNSSSTKNDLSNRVGETLFLNNNDHRQIDNGVKKLHFAFELNNLKLTANQNSLQAGEYTFNSAYIAKGDGDWYFSCDNASYVHNDSYDEDIYMCQTIDSKQVYFIINNDEIVYGISSDQVAEKLKSKSKRKNRFDMLTI